MAWAWATDRAGEWAGAPGHVVRFGPDCRASRGGGAQAIAAATPTAVSSPRRPVGRSPLLVIPKLPLENVPGGQARLTLREARPHSPPPSLRHQLAAQHGHRLTGEPNPVAVQPQPQRE